MCTFMFDLELYISTHFLNSDLERLTLSLLCRFTEKNLLRIYPYGLRFNSSNYNPHVAWSHGAQMVAFNMQVCYLSS